MKIRALTSFAGVLTMRKDEVLEYDNNVVLQDLLHAGYVEKVTEGKLKEGAKANDGKQNNKQRAGSVPAP